MASALHDNAARIPFPEDVLLQVFEALELADLFRCRLACHFFEQLIRESAALQYKIELLTAGFQDDSTFEHTGPRARLQMLQRQQTAWHSFRNMTYDASVDDLGRAHHRLSDFFVGRYSASARTLSVIDFTDADHGVPRTQYTPTNFTVQAFAMNSRENIVVLSESPPRGSTLPFRFHLRELSHISTAHPRASLPVLEFHPDNAQRVHFYLVELQIMNDYVGVLLRYLPPREGPAFIVLWHWPSGKLVATYRQPFSDHLDAFAFLSDNTIIVGASRRPESPTLYVYTFPSFEDEPFQPNEAFRLRACYALPRLQPAIAAFIGSMSHPSSIRSTKERPTFSIHPENRTFSFNFTVRTRTQATYSWQIFSRCSTFLEYEPLNQNHGSTLLQGSPPPVFPWEEWGPPATRWFPLTFSLSTSVPVNRSWSSRTIMRMGDGVNLIDFNRYAGRPLPPPDLDLDSMHPFPLSSRYISSSTTTTISLPHLFEGIVESSLPYRETTVPIAVPISMDDNTMVLSNRDGEVSFLRINDEDIDLPSVRDLAINDDY